MGSLIYKLLKLIMSLNAKIVVTSSLFVWFQYKILFGCSLQKFLYLLFIFVVKVMNLTADWQKKFSLFLI